MPDLTPRPGLHRVPFTAEPFSYVRAWLCYRLVMALPTPWGWPRLMLAILPYAGDWAYRHAPDGDTAHLGGAGG